MRKGVFEFFLACHHPVAGPPARSAAIQWLARPARNAAIQWLARLQGSAAGSWRAARKGVPLEVGGPPARNATIQWLDRPQGIPFSSGRAETTGTTETAGKWQAMLPRLAIGSTEGNVAAPSHWPVRRQCCCAWSLARAKPASLFLARSTSQALSRWSRWSRRSR